MVDPVVSVIVPVHNRRELVRRAVDSLLAQDFDQPYEIVVVDDGSTDGSAEAVEGMDPRVKVVRQTNQGAAQARHQGVASASAPFVAFLDSDDVALPNHISELYNALMLHPECIMSCGLGRNVETGRYWLPNWIGGSIDGRHVVLRNPILPMLSDSNPLATAMTIMAHRAFALKSSRSRSFYRAANDYDLQIRLACHGPVVYVASILSEYRFTDGGISKKTGSARQRSFALCAAADVATRLPLSADLRQAFRSRVEAQWGGLAVPLYLQHDWRMLRWICAIAARHARPWRLIRPLWWALDDAAGNKSAGRGSDTCPLWLRSIAFLGRSILYFRPKPSGTAPRSLHPN